MGSFMVRVLGFSGPINLCFPKLVLLAFLSFSNVARATAVHASTHDEWGDDGFLSSSHRILSTYDKCVLTLCGAVIFICAVALLVQVRFPHYAQEGQSHAETLNLHRHAEY